jgi:hypothetical protein
MYTGGGASQVPPKKSHHEASPHFHLHFEYLLPLGSVGFFLFEKITFLQSVLLAEARRTKNEKG